MISSVPRSSQDTSHQRRAAFSKTILHTIIFILLCAGDGGLLQAQMQADLSPQELQDLQSMILPQDRKDLKAPPAPRSQAVAAGPLVPYEEAMQKLRERRTPKILDVEAVLAKVKPPVTAAPVPASVDSRGKTVKALEKRRASPNRKPKTEPVFAPGNEAAAARMEKEVNPKQVDVDTLYPARKTPPGFVPSKAKNGLTGSLVSREQVHRLLEEKKPASTPAEKGAAK